MIASKIKKSWLAFLTLIACQFSFSQADSIIKHDKLQQLIGETKEIMGILGIPIRYNIHLDGPIVFEIYDFTNGYAAFWTPVKVENESLDSAQFFYSAVRILMNSRIAESLQHPDTTLEYYNSEASIVHELTHHLQVHIPRVQGPLVDRRAHANNPREIEASAVAGYYFLKRYKPELIGPNLSTPPRDIWLIRKRFANRFAEIVNPKENPTR